VSPSSVLTNVLMFCSFFFVLDIIFHLLSTSLCLSHQGLSPLNNNSLMNFFVKTRALNSGLHVYKAGALLLEPHLQSIFLWLFWRWGLAPYFPWLTSSQTQSSQVARSKLLVPGYEPTFFLFWYWGLNSGLHTWKAGALPLELHL
jgi:hypothetical protein